MNLRILPLLLSTALLSGCGSDAFVQVLQPTTETVRASRTLTSTLKGRPSAAATTGVQVETVGNDTVLTWLGTGQAFVLKNLSGYWGRVSLDGADLWIGKVRIRLDAERLRVESADARAEALVSRDAKDKRLEVRVSRGVVSIKPG